MKVHPDVQSSPTAKEINSQAIANLNAYLDSVALRLKSGGSLVRRTDRTLFGIEFLVAVEERIKGKKQDILVQRKIELSLPPPTTATTTTTLKGDKLYQFQRHVQQELAKLLHIAGLKVDKKIFQVHESNTTTVEDQIDQAWKKMMMEENDNDNDDDTSSSSRNPHQNLSDAQIQYARHQKYQRNRQAFVERINWKRYDQVYTETVRDVQADALTDGLIRNDPQRRMAHLADLLSRVRVLKQKDNANGQHQEEGEVDPIMQLIAVRRLGLLLDEHWDALKLEDLGKMWESTVMVLTPARSYNTSSTALYKQQQRKQQQPQTQEQSDGEMMAKTKHDADGFAFTLHHDNSVTMHVPVDFRDDELLVQLKRHVKDYYSLVVDLGLEDIFPPAKMSSSSV